MGISARVSVYITACVAVCVAVCIVVSASETVVRSHVVSDPFHIPSVPPQTVITSQTMTMASSVVTLDGNVVASRAPDLLTCGRALLGDNPRWLVATFTPKLYRKEALATQSLTREMTLEARTIRWDEDPGRVNASDAVNVKLEERTWDLATYSWVIITADEMTTWQASETIHFNGNVRIKDADHFGRGQRLDYFKASSSAFLSGDAYMETEEWNEKKRKMEKKILTGDRIIYNTQTKEMKSE